MGFLDILKMGRKICSSLYGCHSLSCHHQVRKCEDYIPELDFIMEEDVYPVALMVRELGEGV